jgi:hypothetical protein
VNAGPDLTRQQQIVLCLIASVLGLGLAAILHAGVIGSIALVAAVGIAIGIGVAARQNSDR